MFDFSQHDIPMVREKAKELEDLQKGMKKKINPKVMNMIDKCVMFMSRECRRFKLHVASKRGRQSSSAISRSCSKTRRRSKRPLKSSIGTSSTRLKGPGPKS